MRRIVTHREQAALMQRWADNAVDSSATGVAECDPSDPTCRSKSDDKPVNPATDSPDTSPAQHSFERGLPGSPSGPSTSSPSALSPAGGGGSSTSAPVSFTPSKGVEQWRTQVEQGLTRNGLPLSLAPNVLKQMQSESSGDPNAINRTDSNAQAGHPSQGLLQTIPSTFQQYHLPGDSNSITDPQANVDSAIGYAKSRYGPTLMDSRGNGMGSMRGY